MINVETATRAQLIFWLVRNDVKTHAECADYDDDELRDMVGALSDED